MRRAQSSGAERRGEIPAPIGQSEASTEGRDKGRARSGWQIGARGLPRDPVDPCRLALAPRPDLPLVGTRPCQRFAHCGAVTVGKGWKQSAPAADHSAGHTALQSDIVRYIEACGGWVCNLAGSKYQRAGLPDLIGFLWHPVSRVPVFFAIEVKTGTGKLRADQKAIRDEIVQCKGIFVEARSLDQVEDALLAAGLVLPPLLR